MPPEESQYPRDWLRVAEKDCRRKAIEKYLNAYPLSKGWALRRVHDLEVLVNEASVHMPGLERYVGACRKISGYYLTERYPFMDSPLLTLEEVSGSRDEIVELVELIRPGLR